MSGNRSFERSMNGINNIEVNDIEFADGSTISSASSLVQLDTNNNFIGNNTFNVNLPTSSVNPNLIDINDNTILNKHAGDKLYSATDQNDFPTAFERDGLTGEITLTTADTGIPLSGDTSITSITDAEISAIATNTADITTNSTAIATNTTNIATNTSNIATNTTNIATNTTAIATNTSNIATNSTAIATNTSAIGSLTTATNPCFKTASINGQNLILTPIFGNPTTLPIPSGGGGFDFFLGRSLLSSITNSNNLRFSNMSSSSNVNFADNGGGTSYTAGARFLASPTTAGDWLIGLTGMNLYFNGLVYIQVSKISSSGTITDEGYIFNQQTNSLAWQTNSGIWAVNVASGDTIVIRPNNSYPSNISNNFTSFWGIKLG